MPNKRPIYEILRDSQSVDAEKIATEVLTWITNNVENYVDDNMRVFKLDLVLDSTEGMIETKKLQDLYRALPEDDKGMSKKELETEEECRRILNEITSKAHEAMVKNEEALKGLFNRLIFYYEKIIPNPENKARAHEIDAEIRQLLSKKDAAKTEDAKAKVQKKIMAKIDEGTKLLQFQKFDGQVTIPKFEYEPFDMNVQIRDPKTKEVAKEYMMDQGFTVWVELSYGIKKRQTAIF